MNSTERLEVNGVHYRVRVVGEGPALMLLHGFTGDLHTWDRFVPTFARTYRTITVDLIGHGGTDAPADPERYRMERCIEDLDAVLEVLGVDRVNLLGYSMGGRVAMHVAAAMPEKVSTLVLESASPGIADEAERAARVVSDEALADAIERDGVPAFVERWERLPMFTTQEQLPEEVRRAVREQRLRNKAVGLANSLRGMGAGVQRSLMDVLAGLSIPTLLIAGESDEKYSAMMRDMAAIMPNARVVIYPGVGHTVHLERPVEFENTVVKFLDEHRKTNAANSEGTGR